jgi:RNA-binding protein
MINSKQRSYLRALANGLDSVVLIGKGGIDDNVIRQVNDVLEARELVKLGVLKNSSIDAWEACDVLCEATGAEPVQVIGNKLVIYRPSKERPSIELPD